VFGGDIPGGIDTAERAAYQLVCFHLLSANSIYILGGSCQS
jgi:hypothetical protein